MQFSKPDYSASIVSVKAGQVIPETFLHKLLTENRSVIGFVIQDKHLEVEKHFDLESVEHEMKFFQELQENTKKFNRMFCFQAFPPEYDEDERQPWTIIKDSKGNPLMVVAIEGDFPGRSLDGSSEMLGLINEYIGPKIEGLFGLVGNDPKKLYAAMRDPKAFGTDIMNVIGHRGHFFFMPTEGDVFAHGKEGDVPQNGDFSWGAASFTYGYTESAIAAATPTPTPAPEPAVRKSKYASDDSSSALAPEKPKVDDNGIHHLPEKPPVKVPEANPAPPDPIKEAASAIADGHWEHPPVNLHGKKLKQWYRQMSPNNDLIPDWGKKPRVWVAHKTVVKDLKDLSQTALANIPAALPVISGDQQAKAKDFIKKFLSGSSNVIENPLELQKQESKLAVFSELCLTGGLDEIDTWPVSAISAFCREHPEAAWLAIIELRADRRRLKTSLAVGDKTLGELTGTEKPTTVEPVSPAETPLKPEVPATPVHTPHKKSKYA